MYIYIHIRNDLWSKFIILFGKPRLSEAYQSHTMQNKFSETKITLITKKKKPTDDFRSEQATFSNAELFLFRNLVR